MIKLNISTPQKKMFEGEVQSLTCPTQSGMITILPSHEQLVSAIDSGEMHFVDASGALKYLHVSGGFLHVLQNSEVRILADAAEHDAEIDVARAEEAYNEARQLIKEQMMSDEEYAITASLIRKNFTRMKVARKHSQRHNGITHEGTFEE